MYKIIIAIIALLAMTGCSGSIPAQQPESLYGTWTSSSTQKTPFNAEISKDLITVSIVSDGTKALYWKGTFSLPAGDIPETLTVVSQVDKEAVESSIFGSNDDTKEFKYSRSAGISFDFTVMGVTQTITLTKK